LEFKEEARQIFISLLLSKMITHKKEAFYQV
jgi:hypothetical protein